MSAGAAWARETCKVSRQAVNPPVARRQTPRSQFRAQCLLSGIGRGKYHELANIRIERDFRAGGNINNIIAREDHIGRVQWPWRGNDGWRRGAPALRFGKIPMGAGA